MHRALLALALLLAACGADDGKADSSVLCEFADELTAERPASYVGSDEHVEDVRELARVVPPELRADAEHYLEFVRAGIDDPDIESWPAEIRASVDELQEALEESCR